MTKPLATVGGPVRAIRIDRIDIPADRIRSVTEADAQAIADSIREVGQLQPIGVRAKGGDKYDLIYGGHRIAACRILGKATIEARLLTAEGLQARLCEIDENLGRRDLDALDRAASYAERKRVYEELYPSTKQGTAGKQAIENKETAKIAVWTPVLSFAAATANATGKAERSVRRAVQMHAALAPAVRARLAGTALARQEGELFRLSRLAPTEQARVVELLLTEGGPRKVAVAQAQIQGRRAAPVSPTDKQFQDLVGRWGRYGAPAKRQFLAWLAENGEIPAIREDEAA